MQPDYSLYLVTDRGLSGIHSTYEIIKMAVAGGASIVQLREKTATTREFLSEAQKVKDFCGQHNVLFIINDRIDIALAVDADGVHLGQDDMPIEIARSILGPGKIIGISAFDNKEAIRAEQAGADYLGVSPIFTTPTKPELDKGIGLKGLAFMRQAVSIPLVAIGGLDQTNAYDVIKAGADSIAVVSAIVSAENPCQATAEIKHEIDRARKELT